MQILELRILAMQIPEELARDVHYVSIIATSTCRAQTTRTGGANRAASACRPTSTQGFASGPDSFGSDSFDSVVRPAVSRDVDAAPEPLPAKQLVAVQVTAQVVAA